MTGWEKTKELKSQGIRRIFYVDVDIIKIQDRSSIDESDNDPGAAIFREWSVCNLDP